MRAPRLLSICAASYLLVIAACTVAGAAVPDLADPVASASLVVQLWKSGTIPAALIVAAFVGLSFASRKVAWLSKGYAALVSASVLAGLAVIIEPATRGTTPTASMIGSALLAAVALALKGRPAPASSARANHRPVASGLASSPPPTAGR